jgi:hypothetical protein
MVYIHNRVFFNHKEERNYVVCKKMEGTRDDHLKQNKPNWERQILHVLSHMQSLILENNWQECKTVSLWRWDPVGKEREKGKGEGRWIYGSTLYTCMKTDQGNLWNWCKKAGRWGAILVEGVNLLGYIVNMHGNIKRKPLCTTNKYVKNK